MPGNRGKRPGSALRVDCPPQSLYRDKNGTEPGPEHWDRTQNRHAGRAREELSAGNRCTGGSRGPSLPCCRNARCLQLFCSLFDGERNLAGTATLSQATPGPSIGGGFPTAKPRSGPRARASGKELTGKRTHPGRSRSQETRGKEGGHRNAASSGEKTTRIIIGKENKMQRDRNTNGTSSSSER
ncbi:hypothetical protein AAFF_G00373450 [Aldrovandia affinis]|uniref:Uncharacterized protein n=1 Tax=Aldrovandia affinis TaxID=143900 RepID=A0AAD7SGG2_9TELE|nr:hypothetical protein AAFF_G00373450 [Aldrovandia affinis]